MNANQHYLPSLVSNEDASALAELFDFEYYLLNNARVLRTVGSNPADIISEFLNVGVFQNRQINSFLVPSYYEQGHGSDKERAPYLLDIVRARGVNFNDPHPLFNCRYYTEQLDNADRHDRHPLFHFLQNLPSSKRIVPHPLLRYTSDIPANSSDSVLLNNCTELQAINDESQFSRLETGDKSLSPFAELVVSKLLQKYSLIVDPMLFDVDFYRAAYEDVTISGMSAVVHYIVHGRQEGRLASQYFADFNSDNNVLQGLGAFDWREAVLATWCRRSRTASSGWIPSPWQRVSSEIICVMTAAFDGDVALFRWDDFVDYDVCRCIRLQGRPLESDNTILKTFGVIGQIPTGVYILVARHGERSQNFVVRPIRIASVHTPAPWATFDAIAGGDGGLPSVLPTEGSLAERNIIVIVHGYGERPDEATLRSLEMQSVRPSDTIWWRYGDGVLDLVNPCSGWLLFVEDGSLLRPNAVEVLSNSVPDDRNIVVICWQSMSVTDPFVGGLIPRPLPMWSPSLIEAGGSINGCAMISAQRLDDICGASCFYDALLRLDAGVQSGKIIQAYLSVHGPKTGWAEGERLALERTAIDAHLKRKNRKCKVAGWDVGYFGDFVWTLPSISLGDDLVTVLAVAMATPAADSSADADSAAELIRGLVNRTSHKSVEVLALMERSPGASPAVAIPSLPNAYIREVGQGSGDLIAAIRDAVSSARGHRLAILDLAYEVYTPAWVQRLVRNLGEPGVGAVIGVEHAPVDPVRPRVTLTAEALEHHPDLGDTPAVRAMWPRQSDWPRRWLAMPCLMADRAVMEAALRNAEANSCRSPTFWITLLRAGGRRILVDSSVEFRLRGDASPTYAPESRTPGPLWSGKYVDGRLPKLSLL